MWGPFGEFGFFEGSTIFDDIEDEMGICASREDQLILGTTPKMGEIGSGPTLLEVLTEFDSGDKLGFVS